MRKKNHIYVMRKYIERYSRYERTQKLKKNPYVPYGCSYMLYYIEQYIYIVHVMLWLLCYISYIYIETALLCCYETRC